MSYTGQTSIYWQNTWLDSNVLRGGLYAMTFKG
ncbi:hypothetical protein SHPE106448_15400 [Shewanella pealeana]